MRLFLGQFHKPFHAGVFIEIGLDKFARFLAGEFGGLFQPVAAHAVDDAEIDGLGEAAHRRGDLVQAHAVKLGRGGGMDVFVVTESL